MAAAKGGGGVGSVIPASKDALLKSYRKRLKEDISAMLSNFAEIIKLCKVEDESQVSRATQCEEDAFEMQVRAANMVRGRRKDQFERCLMNAVFLCRSEQPNP